MISVALESRRKYGFFFRVFWADCIDGNFLSLAGWAYCCSLRPATVPFSGRYDARGRRREFFIYVFAGFLKPAKTYFFRVFGVDRSGRILFQGELDVEAAAGAVCFVVAGAFYPDFSVVGLNNASRDGQSQSRTAAFEFGAT